MNIIRRCFSRILHWKVKVAYYVLDDAITPELFEEALSFAGQYIGIGRWRAENGGPYGRYRIVDIKWKEVK